MVVVVVVVVAVGSCDNKAHSRLCCNSKMSNNAAFFDSILSFNCLFAFCIYKLHSQFCCGLDIATQPAVSFIIT